MLRRPSRRSTRSTAAAWVLCGPYLALLAIFGVLPGIYAIYESLTAEPTGGTGSVGLGNFRHVFRDFRFWPAVTNVATFMAIWIPVMVIGALAFALMLHERAGRFSSAMRLIFFLPGAVTGSAAVLLWYFMLDPQLSPFSAELKALGLRTGNDVFTAGHLAPIFALIAFMTGVGSWIVIMFGAFQAIPHDVIEAARVDGAGGIRMALTIKIPMVSKYVVYMMILSFAAGLQVFVEPALFYSITGAGSDWWSLNQLGLNYALEQGEFGQAATVSVILLLLSSLIALAFVMRSKFFQTEAQG